MSDTLQSNASKIACEICNKEFTTTGLPIHMTKVHNQQKQFQCVNCRKTFRDTYGLNRHAETCKKRRKTTHSRPTTVQHIHNNYVNCTITNDNSHNTNNRMSQNLVALYQQLTSLPDSEIEKRIVSTFQAMIAQQYMPQTDEQFMHFFVKHAKLDEAMVSTDTARNTIRWHDGIEQHKDKDGNLFLDKVQQIAKNKALVEPYIEQVIVPCQTEFSTIDHWTRIQYSGTAQQCISKIDKHEEVRQFNKPLCKHIPHKSVLRKPSQETQSLQQSLQESKEHQETQNEDSEVQCVNKNVAIQTTFIPHPEACVPIEVEPVDEEGFIPEILLFATNLMFNMMVEQFIRANQPHAVTLPFTSFIDALMQILCLYGYKWNYDAPNKLFHLRSPKNPAYIFKVVYKKLIMKFQMSLRGSTKILMQHCHRFIGELTTEQAQNSQFILDWIDDNMSFKQGVECDEIVFNKFCEYASN
jgi:hypothetical protein